MKCHICDKTLTEAEVIPSPSGKGYEPCSVCMEIILDAAYSDGFARDEEEVDFLDEDTNTTQFDPDLIDTLYSPVDEEY